MKIEIVIKKCIRFSLPGICTTRHRAKLILRITACIHLLGIFFNLKVEDYSPNQTQYHRRSAIYDITCIDVDQFDLWMHTKEWGNGKKMHVSYITRSLACTWLKLKLRPKKILLKHRFAKETKLITGNSDAKEGNSSPLNFYTIFLQVEQCVWNCIIKEHTYFSYVSA